MTIYMDKLLRHADLASIWGDGSCTKKECKNGWAVPIAGLPIFVGKYLASSIFGIS